MNFSVFRISNGYNGGNICVIIIESAPTVNTRIFKVKYNFGAFSDIERNSCANGSADNRRCYLATACNGSIGSCGKCQSVYGAELVVRKSEINICGIKSHNIIKFTVGQNQSYFRRFTIGRCKSRRSKCYLIGNDDMNRGFSDDFAVVYHLNNCITRFCGNKNIVFNRAERVVRKFQNRICGNFRRGTSRAYALCRNCGFCIYGNILMFRCQCGSVKHIRRSCGRSNYKTCGNRTLRTIGRAVYDGNVVLTFLFCDVSSRATAVKVYSGNTARFEHYLRYFMHRTAAGERFLSAVKRHKYDFAVCGYSDACSAMSVRIVRTACCGSNILAVTNNPL